MACLGNGDDIDYDGSSYFSMLCHNVSSSLEIVKVTSNSSNDAAFSISHSA